MRIGLGLAPAPRQGPQDHGGEESNIIQSMSSLHSTNTNY